MQNKSAEKIFFDSFAEDQAYDVFDDQGYERLLREFIALVRPLPEESLLDLGCGSGAFIQKLDSSGLTITGVDISFNSVRIAAGKVRQFSFAAADAEELPFPDHQFDIVTLSGLLHHLPILDKALSESRRVLKAGGRVFAYDPNGRNPAMWLYRSPRSPFYSRNGWTFNERLLFSEEIEMRLISAGFHNAFSRSISGIGFKYAKSRLIRTVLPIYNFMDRLLETTALSRRFGAFLISYAEKPRDNAWQAK